MKRLLLLALAFASAALAAEPPLRVFLRSGPKSHGPGAHDYPRFKAEWVPMLQARGAQVTAADAFPTREQLAQTDVLVLHAQEAGNIPAALEKYNAALEISPSADLSAKIEQLKNPPKK